MSSKTIYKYGEPINISITLVNRNFTSPLVEFRGEDKPTIKFVMKDNQNRKIFMSAKGALWCGTGINYRPLSWGENYDFNLDISNLPQWGNINYFNPGNYVIYAELEGKNILGFHTTPIKSNKITIQINS